MIIIIDGNRITNEIRMIEHIPAIAMRLSKLLLGNSTNFDKEKSTAPHPSPISHMMLASMIEWGNASAAGTTPKNVQSRALKA
ncbi:MAG: hypothetical protein ACOY3E_15010 [Pseudomonadota bacterium]